MKAEDAGAHFGFLSAFVSADNPTSNNRTQELLGCRPDGPALIADIDTVTTSTTRCDLPAGWSKQRMQPLTLFLVVTVAQLR